MNPTPADVHVNVVLGNVSVAYAQRNNGISDKLFPRVPVRNMSNLFRKWLRGGWFRAEAKERAPATPSAGGGWKTTTDSYLARVYAFHQDIDGQTIANADSEFDLDRTSTEFVTGQLLLTREAIFQAAYFKQGVWTNDYQGVAGVPAANQFKQWSVAGSTPIEDIRSLVLLMTRRTGYRPNKLVLAPDVANTLELHAEIIDRIKYVQRGIVGTDLLAALFGVPEVLVPDVIINNAPEHNDDTTDELDANFDFVYSGAVLLVYAPDRAGLMTQSAGYIFVWTAYSGYGARIKKIPLPEIDSNRIEGDMAFDVKQVSPNLGAFVRTAI